MSPSSTRSRSPKHKSIPAPTNAGIFRSAITDRNGYVDAGYLALFWIMCAVLMVIPTMLIFTVVAMALDPAHTFAVQDLGIAIGSVCTGFGVAVGAVGAFRMGDKPRHNENETGG